MDSAEPYVTKALLHKLFGPTLAAEVAARYFLEGQGPGGFRFRSEYLSEKVRLCTWARAKRHPVCCPALDENQAHVQDELGYKLLLHMLRAANGLSAFECMLALHMLHAAMIGADLNYRHAAGLDHGQLVDGA